MRSSPKQDVLSALGSGTCSRAPAYGKNKLPACIQVCVTGLASHQAKIHNQFQGPRADWILKLVEQPGHPGLPPSLLLQLHLPSTDTASCCFLQCHCFWAPGLACILQSAQATVGNVEKCSQAVYLKSQVLLSLGMCQE